MFGKKKSNLDKESKKLLKDLKKKKIIKKIKVIS